MNHNQFAYGYVKTRNRKPQWTHKETQYLIREFDKRKDILRPKLGNVVSSAMKHRSWVEISQAVNLTNPHVHRTVTEVQKKWQNLCLRTKRDTGDILEANREDKYMRRQDVESLILGTQSSNDDTGAQTEQPSVFNSQERTDMIEDIVPVKLERLSSAGSDGAQNVYDSGDNSRPNSVPSRLSFSDVEFAQPSSLDFNRPSMVNTQNTPEGMVMVREDTKTNGQNMSVMDTDHNSIMQTSPQNDQHEIDSEYRNLRKETLHLEQHKLRMECEKLKLEKDKLTLETQKLIIEKEKLTLEVNNFRAQNSVNSLPDHGKSMSQLEKDRMILENEKLSQEIKHFKNNCQSESDRTIMNKERHKLETIKLNLEIQNLRGHVGNSSY